MNAFSTVTLIVALVTGNGMPAHKQKMPDMETCLMEAGKFLRHKFPDSVGAKELKVQCEGTLVEDNPS